MSGPFQFLIDWSRTNTFTQPGEDVSDLVRDETGVTFSRGKDGIRRFPPPMAGDCRFQILNLNSYYSPENAASPYYPNITPGCTLWIKLRAVSVGPFLFEDGSPFLFEDGSPFLFEDQPSRSVWRGVVADIIEHPGSSERSVDIVGLGMLSKLVDNEISTPLYENILVSDAMQLVLNKVNWPLAERIIPPSLTTLDWWGLDNEEAFGAIVNLLATEGPGAAVYENPDGYFVFEPRNARQTQARSVTSQVTYRDTELPLQMLTPNSNFNDLIEAATLEIEAKEAAGKDVIWQLGERLTLAANESKTFEVRASDWFKNATLPSPFGINAVQTLTASAVLFSDSYTLSYKGETTGAIAWDDEWDDVQAELEGLSTIGAGNVLVGGGPLNNIPFTVEFRGALKEQEVELLVVTSLLNGIPKAATVKVNERVKGVPDDGSGLPPLPADEVQVLFPDSVLTGGVWHINGNATNLTATASAANVQTVLNAIFGAGNTSVTNGPLGTADIVVTWQGAYVLQDIPLLEITGTLTTSEPSATVGVAMSVKGGGPDYVLVSGDITFLLSDTSGSVVDLTAIAGAAGAVVDGLQQRGSLVTTVRRHQVTYPDNTTVPTGKRFKPPNVLPEINRSTAETITSSFVSHYSQRRPTDLVRLVKSIYDADLASVLLREISDRFTIIAAQPGINADYYQEQIRHSISGLLLTTEIGVEKAGTPAAEVEADTDAPIISGVTISSITSSSALITWVTNEASDSQVEYGTSSSYGSETILNKVMVTSHSVLVSGLTAATLYHFRVKSRDVAGNLGIGSDFTFTSAAAPVLGGMADDGLAHIPTNYNSGFVKPAKGFTYVDDFGTLIRRVSDYDDLGESLSQEYSPHSAWNADGSKLLLLGTSGAGYRVVNSTTGAIVANPGISSSSEAYWSHFDPNIFYYHSSNQIKTYNWSTNTHSVIATFNGTGGLPSYTSISFGGGDVDISEDGDHIPIIGDGDKLGIYQFSNNKFTASPMDFGATNEDLLWGRVTPDNQVIVRLNTSRTLTGTADIGIGDETVNMTGGAATSEVMPGAYVVISGQRRAVVEVVSDDKFYVDTAFTVNASGVSVAYTARMILYDKNMGFVRAIAPFGGHASTGRDINGSPVLVIDAANNPGTIPGGCSPNGIYKYTLSTGAVVCLFGLPDFHLTGHISFDNIRGHNYVLLAYYDGRVIPSTATAMLPSVTRSDWNASGVWKPYYNECVLVKIDGSEVRRLAHHRARLTGFGVPGGSPAPESHFWFTPRANLSKQISSNGYPAWFIFASNMGSLRHKVLTGSVSASAGSRIISGTGTDFFGGSGKTTLGGELTVGGETKIIDEQSSDTVGRVTTNFSSSHTAAVATAHHPDTGIESYVGSIDTPLSDVTGLVISSISSGTPGSTTATITWTTNEAATSQVEWGTDTYYGGGISSFDKTLVTSHSVNLTGLVSGTLYHYRVKSRDAAGNYSLSANQTFTTA